MENNRVKPDFQKDSDGDEWKPKEIVSWSQLDDWEKKYVNIPVSEMFPLLIIGNFLEIKGLINLILKLWPCKFKITMSKKSEKNSTSQIQIGLLRNCKSSKMKMLGLTKLKSNYKFID